jgi:hypothetical protein
MAATLPEEDQKLFAEIMYTWVLTRLNEIKDIYKIDYLFCVMSSEPFNKQFFLISAADRNSVRGTDYEQVYPIGVISEVGEAQQIGMAEAVKKINPKEVLMSHILELGHSITKWRWSSEYGINECEKLNRERVYLPVWGEKIALRKVK